MYSPRFALRDVYLSGLPGLYAHCAQLERLVCINLTDLHVHFLRHSIQMEMFCADWIFSLFSNSVPLSEMKYIYSEFFRDGWFFFYRFVLTLLQRLEDKLL